MVAAEPLLALLADGEAPVDLPALLVAAHPDDEVIGIGAQLSRFRDITLLHATDGAPRDGRDAAMHGFADVESYAAARRRELLEAIAVAGIAADRALACGIPDQQATLRLADLTRQLAALIAARRPAALITHAYEGGHPDHDATAFAVHAALRLTDAPRPTLLEMAGYYAGPQGMETGCFLPMAGCAPVRLPVSPAARESKLRMIACFATQARVLAGFPVDVEALRPAPRYDFTRPPHPGRLHYENHPWGMTGGIFRRMAAEALQALEGNR
ncbi:PIG-L family deacetylase [Roseomonas hellenica]|uniref:PIG-L family deacetylase n=1 Tax=Plastoroseomonas hellenica TaxID=2687306 RepID=A0ABS5EZ13_9PROT|nr:PIG-L deacetylase family protein [Plastoroseomonas hellenica]MBR0665532.1 PIG-L family deacetylase [Plastoroseomonas hellenica]